MTITFDLKLLQKENKDQFTVVGRTMGCSPARGSEDI